MRISEQAGPRHTPLAARSSKRPQGVNRLIGVEVSDRREPQPERQACQEDDAYKRDIPPRERGRAGFVRRNYSGSGRWSCALVSAWSSTPAASGSFIPREVENSMISMCRARSSIFFSRKLSGFSV
jgi:hypothetical protein